MKGWSHDKIESHVLALNERALARVTLASATLYLTGMAVTAGPVVRSNLLLWARDTPGQWHAIIDWYGRQHRASRSSNAQLWPTPQASGTL